MPEVQVCFRGSTSARCVHLTSWPSALLFFTPPSLFQDPTGITRLPHHVSELSHPTLCVLCPLLQSCLHSLQTLPIASTILSTLYLTLYRAFNPVYTPPTLPHHSLNPAYTFLQCWYIPQEESSFQSTNLTLPSPPSRLDHFKDHVHGDSQTLSRPEVCLLSYP